MPIAAPFPAVRLLPAVLLLTVGVVPSAFAQSAAPPATLVDVAPVRQAQVASGREFVGTVMPLKLATVGSAVDGRIVDFPVERGDRVEAGDTLAQVLTGTIDLELKAAEAQLDLSRQELAELENGTRPEELRQAQARATSADATRKFLETRRRRVELLYDRSSAMTRDDVDEAAAAQIEAEQTYQEALAALELAQAGPRPERIAQARARVALQEATVEKLQDQIKKYRIQSRFAGYVIAEHTEEGQWVNSGDPVAAVAALDEVEVEAFVLEEYVPFIRPGISARVEVPSLPDRTFVGAVSSVVPQGDSRTRTFPVRVRVENVIGEDGPMMKSGMLARVVLPTGAETDALLVPKDALVLGGPQPVVWAIAQAGVSGSESGGERQGEARAVPVRLGVAQGDAIQVIGDLSETDLVIVRGNERIIPPRTGNPTVRWTPRPPRDGA
ncbi:efflux RND transporter periplasmic adaptor subunit [Alienimonas californiensis]|uniref:Cation efflux system protein CusB n=1 Tax=Alienimonas californiensis TaxID=2527989 RepID=A0A517P8W7_9PLAN|nr:efflux RND transporter periplasmic adaptor subunit [Alienimonas californiensis]QDT15811.1 Cation efflux system protein CusB precursor [Alienimonas californiensis]